ncbi:uncharacterized protein LOC134848377 isoform X2 [Symsagittifera roscoffensis]|uniref:uncharacterized protein LOC134848377 isoform X2 n=1 Tax=Symsagittifera roscoffensis TaxID=84072 RepID=UPI00307BDE25
MIWEKGVAAFGESPEDLKGKRVQLPTYPQFLPLVTYGFYAEFRSRVIFNRTVWRDAEKVFNGLNKLNNCWTQTGCTVVYVHMRMGDYKYHLNALQWDCDVFEKTNYLQDAFKKVATLYKKPMFYIVGYSDKDVDNFFHTHKEEFSPYHYKLVAPYEREMLPHRRTKSYQGIDLALLAMSEVLILSYGSYGDFGALLGRDKKHVLYPGKHKAHDETGVNLGLPHFLPIPWNITETERTK